MVGVPLDQATTNRAGTRFGPRSIRLASRMYGAEFMMGKGFLMSNWDDSSSRK